MKELKITAIIPAYNEAGRIGETVRALKRLHEVEEVLVVDDGSRDSTSREAKNAGADRVVTLPRNTGKGQALARGVKEAQGDILCFADADLGETATEFRALIKVVADGGADMAVASWPPPRRPAGFGFVKRLASWGIRRLSGYCPVSPLSGQRVLKREVWETASHSREGFGVEVGLTVECVRNGFSVAEIPVKMAHRETGRDWQGFRHRGRQFIQVLRTLWRLRTRKRVG